MHQVQNNNSASNDLTGILEQYKILAVLYDNEANRFWMRFNISIGLQIVAIVGIIANIDILSSNPIVFRFALLLFSAVSIMMFLISLRGFYTQRMLLKIIKDYEKESQGMITIYHRASKYSTLPQYINIAISIVISLVFAVAWLMSLFYLEFIDFSLVIPSS